MQHAVLIFAAAVLLPRLPYAPLSMPQWLLLGLGLTQVPAGVAAFIAAHDSAWLDDFDRERFEDGLADPDIDVALNGDGTADVELLIEFEEGLQLVPDENGDILYQGTRWSVADVPIDVAEGVDKVAKQEEAGDA